MQNRRDSYGKKRLSGLGLRVAGLGFRVYFRALGLGFRV